MSPRDESPESRIARLENEVSRLRADLDAVTGCVLRMSGARPAAEGEADQYVTLDQLSAMVHRSKRTVEKYRDRMPDPDVQGGGGRASMWIWVRIRPWMEQTFGVPLPERYPY